ncbi:MAG: cytidine deaminase [Candidatus Eisenbacteria bacterium]|nr:cytidine deaminase [Candidatus Eisenbacteria bacterium]
MDARDRQLIAAAAEVIRRNFREDRHTVGAAVRCPSGRTYVGVNVDSCGYGPCAEPIAIGAAFSAGESGIEAIVAVEGKSGSYGVLSPCGNCRQLLLDYAPDAMVIVLLDGNAVKVRARDLLPAPYRSY